MADAWENLSSWIKEVFAELPTVEIIDDEEDDEYQIGDYEFEECDINDEDDEEENEEK